jgi:uncharacterized membrane protein
MTLYDAMKLITVTAVLAELVLVAVYYWAMRQKNHRSFKMLLISALFYIAYSVLTSFSYFVEIPQELSTSLYRYGTFCVFPAVVLGVLGTISLARAYVSAPPVPTLPPQKTSGKWGPP